MPSSLMPSLRDDSFEEASQKLQRHDVLDPADHGVGRCQLWLIERLVAILVDPDDFRRNLLLERNPLSPDLANLMLR